MRDPIPMLLDLLSGMYMFSFVKVFMTNRIVPRIAELIMIDPIPMLPYLLGNGDFSSYKVNPFLFKVSESS